MNVHRHSMAKPEVLTKDRVCVCVCVCVCVRVSETEERTKASAPQGAARPHCAETSGLPTPGPHHTVTLNIHHDVPRTTVPMTTADI